MGQMFVKILAEQHISEHGIHIKRAEGACGKSAMEAGEQPFIKAKPYFRFVRYGFRPKFPGG